MDILFEAILEMILEGSFGAVESRRVPLPVRILAAALLILFFGGVVFLIILVGINCINGSSEIEGGLPLGILMFVIAAFIVGVLVWKFVKIVKKS